VDLTDLSAVIAAIGVVIGVGFAIIQMQDARRVRHTGLIIELDPALRPRLEDLGRAGLELHERDFSGYDDFVAAYGEPMSDTAFGTVALYYEGLGFLLHRDLIDLDEIEYLVSNSVPRMWQRLQPVVVGAREHYDEPALFRWFEYLAGQMGRRGG
jgi:hypothetical protein